MSAFKYGCIDDLEAIDVIIHDFQADEKLKNEIPFTETAFQELEKERDHLTEIAERLTDEIVRIKESFPCNQIEFLADKTAVETRKNELNALIETCNKNYQEYQKQLDFLLSDGKGGDNK